MVPQSREILQRFVWWVGGTNLPISATKYSYVLAILRSINFQIWQFCKFLRRCWRIYPLLVHVKSWKNCGRIYSTWFVSSVWTERKYWTFPYKRRVQSYFSAGRKLFQCHLTKVLYFLLNPTEITDHRTTKDLQNTFESLLTVRVLNENTESESERELRFIVVF